MKKILVLLIAIVTISCQEKSNGIAITPITSFTDALVQKNVDNSHIAGASVLVFQKGKTLLKKTYGYASLELSTPVPENGIFEIGSVTKQFMIRS